MHDPDSSAMQIDVSAMPDSSSASIKRKSPMLNETDEEGSNIKKRAVLESKDECGPFRDISPHFQCREIEKPSDLRIRFSTWKSKGENSEEEKFRKYFGIMIPPKIQYVILQQSTIKGGAISSSSIHRALNFHAANNREGNTTDEEAPDGSDDASLPPYESLFRPQVGENTISAANSVREVSTRGLATTSLINFTSFFACANMCDTKLSEISALLQANAYPLNSSYTKFATVGLKFLNGEFKPIVKLSGVQEIHKGVDLDADAWNMVKNHNSEMVTNTYAAYQKKGKSEPSRKVKMNGCCIKFTKYLNKKSIQISQKLFEPMNPEYIKITNASEESTPEKSSDNISKPSSLENNDRQGYPREHVGIMRPSEVTSRQENPQYQGYNSQPQRNQYSYDNSQYRQNQDRYDHQQYHRNNQYSPRNQGPQNYNPRGYNHNYQSGNRNYNQSPRNEQYANHRENPADILDQLGGSTYFSTFDLASGFHQIPVKETDRWKTAFSTLQGHYQYTRMPMGLKSAPSTFQRLMDNVLRGLQDVEMLVYLDDVIIYAKDLHEHQRKTKLFLDRLRMANLVLQTDKVHLLHKEAGFLGHIVSEKGVEPDPRKVEATSNWPRPTNVKQIRQYLGTTGYYRRFIKDYARIASPLSNLTKKNKPFEWTEECETSFLTLKQHLCKAPILQFPDMNQKFTLTTDASDYAIGAVLSQTVDGNDLPPLGSPSETDTDSEVPRDDPRTSALREQDTEDSSVEAETRVHQDASSDAESESSLAQEPLDSEIELELTSAATSVDEPLEDDVFESELDTTLTDAEISQARENVAKSLRRSFEAEDVPSRVNLRSIINDSRTSLTDEEDIDKETRETLKELDPYDAETGRDDEMEKRIQQLVEASSDILSSEQGGSSDDSSSAETTIDRDEFLQQIQERAKRDAFKTTTSIIGRPRAVSTPAVVAQTTRPRLSSIPENPCIQLNFSRPPLDNTLSDQIIPIAIPNLNPIYNENTIDYAQENCSNTRQNRVTLSREGLTYVNDHIAHFIYADANTNDNVGKLLQDIGAIDLKNIKSKHPNVGQVLTTKFKNRYIFTVIVLQKHYENLSVEALEKGINNLKRVCKRKGVNSLRIARNCSTTNNLPPGALAQTLSKIFTNPNTSITLCYGNTSAVPEHERLRIIQLLHSSPFGGHKGITQTYRKIRERFYWRNMRDDITEFINNCAGCQENKITRAKTRNPMIITDTPIESFDKVSIDTVGKLRTTTTGNCHILTMQCHLTKYLLAIPLPNIKATTIANALARNLICQFGAPRAILSDQGRPRQMFQNSRFLQLRTYNARRNKQKYRRMRSKYMDK
ncbi:unnamed protein product [Trichogramma brassicae]|uniref:RNA-directed DNA polymerase n=1 Tax=Trichogramma brassicae TaxID=86971 RepID=A0A6H5IWI7_9HYME|nr:unnamed protein product [Trichogramma brassicae]